MGFHRRNNRFAKVLVLSITFGAVTLYPERVYLPMVEQGGQALILVHVRVNAAVGATGTYSTVLAVLRLELSDSHSVMNATPFEHSWLLLHHSNGCRRWLFFHGRHSSLGCRRLTATFFSELQPIVISSTGNTRNNIDVRIVPPSARPLKFLDSSAWILRFD